MPICTHVAFRVHDLARSIRFYEQVLPARVVARKDGRDFWRSAIAWLEPAGQAGFAVVLIEARRARWLLHLFHALVPRACRSYEHAGFACDSREEVVAAVARARQAGARVLCEPSLVDERTGFIGEVVDPDGNAVEWTHGQSWG